MNGSEADNYELRLNYSKEVLAKIVCQNGAKEEYQDTLLNRQQLGTESLKVPKVTLAIPFSFFLSSSIMGIMLDYSFTN
jgi:hypothetical protein